MGPQGKRPPDTRSAADGILAGCQQRAYASKASLFPCPTKDQLAKALAPMLGAGSGERLTGGRPLCPDRPPATGCQPSGLDCEYAIRTQPCRMNLKSLMQPGPRVSALGLLSILGLQSYSSSDLINTPLQRGVVRARDGRKPFQRFPGLRGRNGPFDDPLYRRPGGAPSSWWSDASTVGKRIETVETVSMSPAPIATPLKRGVNERFAEPGV